MSTEMFLKGNGKAMRYLRLKQSWYSPARRFKPTNTT